MDRFRSGRHVVHSLHAHLVFTTKYRRRAIETERVVTLLKDTMASVAADMGAEVIAAEADGDHLHLLAAYPPHLALSQLVNSLKGVSSRMLRQKRWPEVEGKLCGKAFWSPSYCVVSAGGAPLDVIKTYVETQNAEGRLRKGAAARAADKERRRLRAAGVKRAP